MNIYVAGALKHSTLEHRAEVEEIKRLLVEAGHVVLKFVIDPSLTPAEVYDNDIHKGVGEAHIVIAVLGGASDGRGFEIATSLFRFCTPVLVAVRQDQQDEVSRLIGGISSEVPKEFLRFSVYENPREVVEVLLPDFQKVAYVMSGLRNDFWARAMFGPGYGYKKRSP